MIVLLVDEFSAVPEIDHKYLIGFFAQSNQEILRINVIVDKIFGMNPLYSIN